MTDRTVEKWFLEERPKIHEQGHWVIITLSGYAENGNSVDIIGWQGKVIANGQNDRLVDALYTASDEFSRGEKPEEKR